VLVTVTFGSSATPVAKRGSFRAGSSCRRYWFSVRCPHSAAAGCLSFPKGMAYRHLLVPYLPQTFCLADFLPCNSPLPRSVAPHAYYRQTSGRGRMLLLFIWTLFGTSLGGPWDAICQYLPRDSAAKHHAVLDGCHLDVRVGAGQPGCVWVAFVPCRSRAPRAPRTSRFVCTGCFALFA